MSFKKLYVYVYRYLLECINSYFHIPFRKIEREQHLIMKPYTRNTNTYIGGGTTKIPLPFEILASRAKYLNKYFEAEALDGILPTGKVKYYLSQMIGSNRHRI